MNAEEQKRLLQGGTSTPSPSLLNPPPASLYEDRFLPFHRIDMYGNFLSSPLPMWERVRLAIFAMTILPVKFFVAVWGLIGVFFISRIGALLAAPFKRRLVLFFVRMCLFGTGFYRIRHIRLFDDTDKPEPPPVIVVSNHASWVDILVHFCLWFPSFVARDGTQHIVMVGRIAAEELKCIFVRRSERAGVSARVKERVLAQAQSTNPQPMCLFPEATTTNGRYMLPFKTGAFLPGLPVKPVVLLYSWSKHQASPTWEAMTAVQQMFVMLSSWFYSITVLELPLYEPNEAEKADPILFATNVRAAMLAACPEIKASTGTYHDKMQLYRILRGKEDRNETRSTEPSDAYGMNGTSASESRMTAKPMQMSNLGNPMRT